MRIRSLALASAVLLSAVPADAETAVGSPVDRMLEEKQLSGAYNPVLVDFLLEEGTTRLSEEQRSAALEQLVAALRRDTEITAKEQKAMAFTLAGAALVGVFGGSDAREAGSVVEDVIYQERSSWIDSAFALQRAGFTEEADAFFESCLEGFVYPRLRGRCAIGLATGNPDLALSRLMTLTEDVNAEVVNVALPLLGELAVADGFPAEKRAEVLTTVLGFTQGLNKGSHGVAACEALVTIGDAAAVETLKRLGTGLMNERTHDCARRGLLLTFGDRTPVPQLQKQIKGGKFSPVEPHERLAAAALLMEAGEPSGFAWAAEQLTVKKKKKKGLGRLMKVSDDEPDLRPDVVRALVRVGGEPALGALRAGFQAAEQGAWLRTWIALGLLELGDDSQAALVRAALSEPDWDFTKVRAATALARHGDRSGVPALTGLYRAAAQGIEPRRGGGAMAFLSGRSAQQQASREARERRLARLKGQIADALVEIGGAESVELLTEILGDPHSGVRSAAARALLRMDEPEVATALGVALAVDYGVANGKSRNPALHAAIVRRSAAAFEADPAATALLGEAASSDYRSVRFLALSVGAEAAPVPQDS